MRLLNFHLIDSFSSRVARRRKPGKKRREKGSLDSNSGGLHNSISSEHTELENSLVAADYVDLLNCTVIHVDAESGRSRLGSECIEGDEDADEGLLRLPKMADTSMDTVGKPLCDVMDRLNGGLDKEERWEHLEVDEEEEEKSDKVFKQVPQPPAQPPFRTDSSGEPPDRAPSDTTPTPTAASPDYLQTSPEGCFAAFNSDAASSSGGHNDAAEPSQPEASSGGPENEGETEAAAGQGSEVKNGEGDADTSTEDAKEKLSPSEVSHPAEFK